MHSDKDYLRRIFQMPQPDKSLQEDFHSAYVQLLSTVPAEYHGLILTLLEKQFQIQTDCCMRSFVEGYELAVGIERKWERKYL